ncbi:MAG: YidC/Oxa1 family insertase periplasmic-domain containing protein [Rhodospirillales bacterium]
MPAAGAAVGAAASAAPAPAATIATERVNVKTDFVSAEIDGLGGNLTRLELLKHRDTQDPAKVSYCWNTTPRIPTSRKSGLIGDVAGAGPAQPQDRVLPLTPGRAN